MALKDNRSYKATRPAGETMWKGVAVSHVGNGRRVEGTGSDPMSAIEDADANLDAQMSGPVVNAQAPSDAERESMGGE